MFLISFGKAETNFKVKADELQNIGVHWSSYHIVEADSLSKICTEFLHIVEKSQPETEFFIAPGTIQYTYNIIALEDCIKNKVMAIAAQPFRESGRLDRVQINWYC